MIFYLRIKPAEDFHPQPKTALTPEFMHKQCLSDWIQMLVQFDYQGNNCPTDVQGTAPKLFP
jgi:hypothetical protein